MEILLAVLLYLNMLFMADDPLTELAMDNFGRENVCVGLFEEFKSDNTLFVNKIFNFIGASTNWSPPVKKGIVNPSLRVFGFELQRFINHFLYNNFNLTSQGSFLFTLSFYLESFQDSNKNTFLYSAPQNII